MKYYKYILVIALWSLVGCSDFLEQEPISNISIDFVFKTPEGLKTGVVGLYNLNRSIYDYGQHESCIPLWHISQTDVVLARSGYISIISKFDKSAMRPDLHGANVQSRFWRHYYKIIDRANAIIISAEAIEGMDEDERLNVLAHARLLRANSLFSLWRIYKNVYITSIPTTPENVFDKVDKPSTKEEIFAALYEDFDFAIEHLDWREGNGLMNKAVAHHLKAKAAMWLEEWQVAADNTEAIFNSGAYSLEPNLKRIFGHPSIAGQGYGDRNSSESLFTIQNEEGSAGAGPWNFINVNFMTNYHRVEGAKNSIDQGGRGFGFLYPNQYLLSLYDSYDKRLEAYYQREFFYNDEENLPEGVELGDKIEIANSGSSQPKYYERISPSCLKYFDENIPADASLSYNNILIYRLSETYLVAAEAHMKLGDGRAGEYLEPLSSRAGVAPPFGNITDNVILKERAKELAFEGQRFFYLKRIGKLVSQVQNFQGDDDYRNEGRGNIKPYYINLPIPQSELELLGSGYPQNEGY